MKNNILKLSPTDIQSNANIKALPSFHHKIAIAQGNGIVIILVNDILYCQAQSNYCKIVLKTGNEYLISKTLKRVQEVLNPASFVKVHQSYLVALDAIVEIDQGLTLNNAAFIPVARSQRKHVLQCLAKQYEMV